MATTTTDGIAQQQRQQQQEEQPHPSLLRSNRRGRLSLSSLLLPQPPDFLRLDSLARFLAFALKALAAAVEAATPMAVSASVASAWYAGQIDEIPIPMPGWTLRFRPAPDRLSGALRLVAVATACALASRVRDGVRSEAARRGRLQLTRRGLANVYGAGGKLRGTLVLSPFVASAAGAGGGAGNGGGGGAAEGKEEEGGGEKLPSSSSSSMTLVDMVDELYEAVLGSSSSAAAAAAGGVGGGAGQQEQHEQEQRQPPKRRVGDVADDLRRVCEAVGLAFRPEVEGANVRSLRAAAVRCREEVFGK